MRMKHSLGVCVCVAMLFMLPLAGCTAAGSVFGPDSTLFRHGREWSEEIERAIAEWAGETEDWTGEDYTDCESPEDVIRDYGAAQLNGAKLETCLVKNLWDMMEQHYYLVGADFSVNQGIQTRWYAIPENFGAIYEYLEGDFRLVYPENSADREEREAPVWNLTEGQLSELTKALSTLPECEWEGLDTEIMSLVNYELKDDPVRAFPYFLGALGIDGRTARAVSRPLTSPDGRGFTLFTTTFGQEETQRWFVMPDNVSAFYEFLPKTGLLMPLAESSQRSIRWFVREKLGLEDKVLQSLPDVDTQRGAFFVVEAGRIENGEFISEQTYYLESFRSEIYEVTETGEWVSVWKQ